MLKYFIEGYSSVGRVSFVLGRAAKLYFFRLAYTNLIPFLIISALVSPVALQQYSRIFISSSDILILVSCFLGSSVGLPVLGDILHPLSFGNT